FDQALQTALGSAFGEEFRAGVTLPRLPAACMARRAAASKPGPASAHARRPETGPSGVLPPLRGGPMSRIGVRYIIDEVPAAVRFYTELLGFTVERDASPAFAAVVRDGVRLLLSGDGSSGKRTL